MRSTNRIAVVAAVFGTTAVWAAGAGAVPAPAADFGQHVATCAQAHLGQRPDPPALACNGHVHANFGEAVQHMRQGHP